MVLNYLKNTKCSLQKKYDNDIYNAHISNSNRTAATLFKRLQKEIEATIRKIDQM